MPQLLVSWALAGGGGAGRLKALGGWGKVLPRAFPPILTMVLEDHTWPVTIDSRGSKVPRSSGGCGGV